MTTWVEPVTRHRDALTVSRETPRSGSRSRCVGNRPGSSQRLAFELAALNAFTP